MRRHERKRDAKVTCEDDPEGYSSEKTALEKADGLKAPAGNTDPCAKASADWLPGVSGRVELYNMFLR